MPGGGHLQAHGCPILTMSEVRPVAGAVLRLLVDPVPVYAWAMLHRRDGQHGALTTLHAVVSYPPQLR